ncbi:MAG: cobalt ECF transporter T component CbiQ, partial [Nitrospirae bacterium]|nr:cobalt ECF transporter T component CbiQ [Nitrospirota bacterium]
MPERFSYTNALREVHPVEKMFFSFSCMTISLICSSIAVYLIVLIIMAAVLVFLAKIPLLSFFKMISGA